MPGARLGVEGVDEAGAADRGAGWLGFAATPAFALMGWASGLSSGENQAMVCAAGLGPSWLGGMVPMYLLMAGLHAGPWLRLIAARARRQGRTHP